MGSYCMHSGSLAFRALLSALQYQGKVLLIIILRCKYFAFLPKFIALGTTDLTAAPYLALGQDAHVALHLPLFSACVSNSTPRSI